jgi:serine-type D-Ala-D-Ala carboxypeptidase/endopeptidase (penicillin-binding protein 4)
MTGRNECRREPQQRACGRQRLDPRSADRQPCRVGGERIAGDRPAGRNGHLLGSGQPDLAPRMPTAVGVLTGRKVDLVHAGIEHRDDTLRALPHASFLGNREQRIDAKHRHAGTESEPLCHGTRGAQAGERTGAAPEHDRLELRDGKAGTIQQLHEGGNECARRVRAAGPLVPQHRPRAGLHRQGQVLGAGIEGKQVQEKSFLAGSIIEAPDNRPMHFVRAIAAGLLAAAAASVLAQSLPPEVDAALARARVPRDAISVVVFDADGKAPARLSHRADVLVNPASVAKLATTFGALELLGAQFTWTTPVYVEGPVVDGTLRGNVYIRGQGDPKLVTERIWLLLRRLQGLGIRAIAGDIVLDQGAFATAPPDPGAFDGEPLRPYNAAPEALLLNYKSVLLTFTPFAGYAQVHMEPPLAGVQLPPRVPLATGDCGDWRALLKADFGEPLRMRFSGAYPLACGERTWPIAYADPHGFAARAVAGMWLQMGGSVAGQVREGAVPKGLAPAFELQSPPLAEVVRDINKYSNNVMAQQVFLTLSLQQNGVGTLDASREILRRWWRERVGGDAPAFGNGSGLSREERITALQLARLLQVAWASPLMPELASSLPLAGVDGTLRRARGAAGLAHLKSGSLRDVAGVAGYVEGASGKRYVLVAIANHPLANAARPAIEALIQWTAHDN